MKITHERKESTPRCRRWAHGDGTTIPVAARRTQISGVDEWIAGDTYVHLDTLRKVFGRKTTLVLQFLWRKRERDGITHITDRGIASIKDGEKISLNTVKKALKRLRGVGLVRTVGALSRKVAIDPAAPPLILQCRIVHGCVLEIPYSRVVVCAVPARMWDKIKVLPMKGGNRRKCAQPGVPTEPSRADPMADPIQVVPQKPRESMRLPLRKGQIVETQENAANARSYALAYWRDQGAVAMQHDPKNLAHAIVSSGVLTEPKASVSTPDGSVSTPAGWLSEYPSKEDLKISDRKIRDLRNKKLPHGSGAPRRGPTRLVAPDGAALTRDADAGSATITVEHIVPHCIETAAAPVQTNNAPTSPITGLAGPGRTEVATDRHEAHKGTTTAAESATAGHPPPGVPDPTFGGAVTYSVVGVRFGGGGRAPRPPGSGPSNAHNFFGCPRQPTYSTMGEPYATPVAPMPPRGSSPLELARFCMLAYRAAVSHVYKKPCFALHRGLEKSRYLDGIASAGSDLLHHGVSPYDWAMFATRRWVRARLHTDCAPHVDTTRAISQLDGVPMPPIGLVWSRSVIASQCASDGRIDTVRGYTTSRVCSGRKRDELSRRWEAMYLKLLWEDDPIAWPRIIAEHWAPGEYDRLLDEVRSETKIMRAHYTRLLSRGVWIW